MNRFNSLPLVIAMAIWMMATPIGRAQPSAPLRSELCEETPGGLVQVDRLGETHLFDRINEERVRQGRARLVLDPTLTELARKKAKDMAINRYFDHVSPAYGTVFDMLQSAGIAYKWAGENIARVTSASMAHGAFMDSPDHRANILSAGYTRVGVGVVQFGGRAYVSQIFMMPR